MGDIKKASDGSLEQRSHFPSVSIRPKGQSDAKPAPNKAPDSRLNLQGPSAIYTFSLIAELAAQSNLFL